MEHMIPQESMIPHSTCVQQLSVESNKEVIITQLFYFFMPFLIMYILFSLKVEWL